MVHRCVATKGANQMADDSWKAHIRYLEEEAEKMGARADKLEAMAADLDSEQKKHALRELVSRLRNEVSEYRQYLALVKQK
jgi:hypothetical protein